MHDNSGDRQKCEYWRESTITEITQISLSRLYLEILFFPLKWNNFFVLFSIVVVNYDGLLRVANLFILGNEKCNQYLKGKITVNESEICAVAETIGAGPCEVNTAFPNTFLGPWLFPSQK